MLKIFLIFFQIPSEDLELAKQLFAQKDAKFVTSTKTCFVEVKIDSFLNGTDSEEETNNLDGHENCFETQFPDQIESCENGNRTLDKSLNELDMIENRIV